MLVSTVKQPVCEASLRQSPTLPVGYLLTRIEALLPSYVYIKLGYQEEKMRLRRCLMIHIDCKYSVRQGELALLESTQVAIVGGSSPCGNSDADACIMRST